MVEVRSFARHDREQLTRLVNAHIATATPGGSIPSAMLLSQLEHPLDEHIIGPWVTDLATFVAVQRDRIVGAAHLRRYADDQRGPARERRLPEHRRACVAPLLARASGRGPRCPRRGSRAPLAMGRARLLRRRQPSCAWRLRSLRLVAACGRICEARGSGAGSSVTPEHGCDWAAPLACSPTPSRTSTSTAAPATTRAAGSCPSTARYEAGGATPHLTGTRATKRLDVHDRGVRRVEAPRP